MEAETYWEDIGSRARRRVLFAPSLLGADPLCVGATIDGLGGRYDWLHLDIMDGHFVRTSRLDPRWRGRCAGATRTPSSTPT